MRFESLVYVLCFLSSGVCAYLLVAAFLRTRERLLLWSAICFCLLALNNLLVIADYLMPISLTGYRLACSLVAVTVLIYGFIWEIE
ncbi:MAG TPA: DUF5985 family protein [Stellaceae bacterium]|nr:DUF5985 family protein [Stellaceae bacterium]